MEAGTEEGHEQRREPRGLQALEEELVRLPHVSAVRVVGDDLGAPVEVHVLARPGKAAKQLVRDIQSVALASFGLRLDRRIVSIVQLDDTATAVAPTPRPAPSFESIRLSENGTRALVQVTLSKGSESIVGYAEGSIAKLAQPRLIAVATLDALHQRDEITHGLDVEGVRLVAVGAHELAVVTLSHVDANGERMLAGAAVVHDGDTTGAVAEAVISLATSPR